MSKTVSRIEFRQPHIFTKKLNDDIAGLAFQDLGVAFIDPRQTNRDYFLTSFHELLHLMLPDLKEKKIFELERKYGAALWRVVLRLNRRKKI